MEYVISFNFISNQKGNIANYNEKRKSKYKLKGILKQLDLGNENNVNYLDKNSMINVEAFLTLASDNDVELSEKDCSYLRQKSTYQNKINYEDAIKELVLLVQEKKDKQDNDKVV